MNALVLLALALCVFALAYRYYAAFLAAKVLVLDPSRVTPAHEHRDGRDFVPMNRFVLFGHHFAAIAGAGPLIGPVLAAQYGYFPGALWILVGSVFAGAVHDLIILTASVRSNGEALYKIAARLGGKTTGIVTAFATFFIIIVSLAGLGVAVVNALKDSAWGFFTVSMTIPIALFLGLYMFRWRAGKWTEGSVIGVVLLLLAVVLGPWIQSSPWAHWFTWSERSVKLMLPVYGFMAAALPVWLLLAPRDYLSTYMKIGTVAFLAAGIAVVHPDLQMPAFTQYLNGGGPVVPGPVWPYVSVTIACGAVSGFHSLISSGTTPKMVDSERDIPMIGYGAMLTEGFVGLMALIAATVLATNDYFAINTTADVWKTLNLSVVELPHLERQIQESLINRPGGAVSLAAGMAYIFSSIPGLAGIMKYWYHFAIMFEALFILTTIDAGTRVARYILGEMLGEVYKPFARHCWLPGTVICSAVVSCLWGFLLYQGQIKTIWPIFGVANQLLATLALALGTTWIIRSGRRRYAWVTLAPFCYLCVTAVTAGVQNIFTLYLPQHDLLKAGLSALLLAMVIVVVVDSARRWIFPREPEGK